MNSDNRQSYLIVEVLSQYVYLPDRIHFQVEFLELNKCRIVKFLHTYITSNTAYKE